MRTLFKALLLTALTFALLGCDSGSSKDFSDSTIAYEAFGGPRKGITIKQFQELLKLSEASHSWESRADSTTMTLKNEGQGKLSITFAFKEDQGAILADITSGRAGENELNALSASLVYLALVGAFCNSDQKTAELCD